MLLVAERDHRIDRGCAAGRDDGGDGADEEEAKDRQKQAQRRDRLDLRGLGRSFDF